MRAVKADRFNLFILPCCEISHALYVGGEDKKQSEVQLKPAIKGKLLVSRYSSYEYVPRMIFSRCLLVTRRRSNNPTCYTSTRCNFRVAFKSAPIRY